MEHIEYRVLEDSYYKIVLLTIQKGVSGLGRKVSLRQI